MGWLFTPGSTRKSQIRERTEGWERVNAEGTTVKSRCLAHCFRGGAFSGVLWTVWERSFERDGQQAQPAQRRIACDLLQYRTGFGWGYKDMDESMHPYFYSCPLKYLAMVPIEQFGGNAEWRAVVHEYHAELQAKRRARREARARLRMAA